MGYEEGIRYCFTGSFKPRSNQIKYIQKTYSALRNKKAIVIEGPTGLGKSLGILASVIPFLFNENKRLVYSTRTISQLSNFIEEVDLVLKANPGRNFSYSLNIGRDSTRKWVCGKKDCASCHKSFDKEQYDYTNFGFKEMKEAFIQGQCPYLVGRFLTSPKAAIVMCTYSKLLSENTRKEFIGGRDMRKDIIMVFDEAHNFFEDISEKPFIEITYKIKKYTQEVNMLELYSIWVQCNRLYSILVAEKATNRIIYDYQTKKDASIAILLKKNRELKEKRKRKSRIKRTIENKKDFTNKILNEWIPEDEKRIENLNGKIQELKKEKNDLTSSIGKLRSDIQYEEVNLNSQIDYMQQLFSEFNRQISEIQVLYDNKNKLHLDLKAVPPFPGSGRIKQSIWLAIHSVKGQIEMAKKDKSLFYETRLSPAKKRKSEIIYYFNGLKKNLNEKIKKLENIEKYTQKIISGKLPAATINLQKNFLKVNEVQKEVFELVRQLDEVKDIIVSLETEIIYIKTIISRLMVNIKKIKNERKNFFRTSKKTVEKWTHLLENDQKLFQLPKEAISTLLQSLSDGDSYQSLIVECCYEIDRNNIGFRVVFHLMRCLHSLLNSVPAKQILHGHSVYDLFNTFDIDQAGNVGRELFHIDNDSHKNNEISARELVSLINEIYSIFSSILNTPQDFMVERNNKNKSIVSIYSINPKQKISEIIRNTMGQVFTSATISPVDVMARFIDENAIAARIQSTFPISNYISKAYIGIHSGHKPELSNNRFHNDEISIFKTGLEDALSLNVNMGVYFSSKTVLRELYPFVIELSKKKGFYVFPGNDANPHKNQLGLDTYKEFILENLADKEFSRSIQDKINAIKLFSKQQSQKHFVLIDIVGGQLAEGVNFNGNQMEATVIVGIPYPDTSSEYEKMQIRLKRLKEITNKPQVAEGIAYRYTAIRKVAQTIGRVHRSETDFGTILLFDERLLGYKTNRNNDGTKHVRRTNPAITDEIWKIIQPQVKETLEEIRF